MEDEDRDKTPPVGEEPAGDETEEIFPSDGLQRRVKLGEYIIERKVGGGGMGQVFKAKQESLQRIVALKVLPRSVASDRELVERFYREARSAAKLVHPNVVQIYSVGEERGVPYFAMEFVDGEDLEGKLHRGERFTVEVTVNIAAGVAMALACANQSGIVHRDIKPGNVMIDARGQVKVTDFGLAKPVEQISDNITQAGYIVGTPTYMSPEQGEGLDVDIRSDIYSLGVVFYELLTGAPPFQAKTPASLIYMHVHQPPIPPSQRNPAVPQEVERLVLRCLEKNPDERYQSPGELLADLLEAAEKVKSGRHITIIFDRSMAAAYARKSRKAAGGITLADVSPSEVANAAKERLILFARYVKGRPVLAGIVATVLVAAVAGAAVALLAAGGSVEPGPPPAREPGKVVFQFSRIRSFLPADATGRAVIEGREVRLPLADLEVSPGELELTLKKDKHQDINLRFSVGPEGVSPEITESLFIFTPDPDYLASLMAEAEEFIERKRPEAALKKLDEVEELSPNFSGLSEAKKRAFGLSVQLEHGSNLYREGDAAVDEKDWKKAIEVLSQVPRDHPRRAEAVFLRRTAETALKQWETEKETFEQFLRLGEFEGTAASLSRLEKEAPKGEDLSNERKRLDEARRLSAEVDAALAEKDLEKAKGLIDRLLAHTPAAAGLAEKSASCEKELDFRKRLASGVAEMRSALEAGMFEEVVRRSAVIRSMRSDGGSSIESCAELPAFESLVEKAKAGLARKRIVASLAALDRAFLEGDSGALKALSARPIELDWSVLKLVRSRHKLLGLKLAPGLEAATAEVLWEWKAHVEKIGKVLGGEHRETLLMRPSASGWAIQAVEKAVLAAVTAGGGPRPTRGRLQGKVVSVERRVVTINLGRDDGVEPRMVFEVYADATTVKLPMTNEVLVVEEKLVATVRVIEVTRKLCQAVVAEESGPVKEGMLAVQSPLKRVRGTAPECLSLRLGPPAPKPGQTCTLEAQVANVDDLAVRFAWSCTGGAFLEKETSVPEVNWLAPLSPGGFELTCTIVSPLGLREKKLTVELAAQEGAFTGFEARTVYLGARASSFADVAFDESSNLYVLTPRGEIIGLSSRTEEMFKVRLRARGDALKVGSGKAYLLDSKTCLVSVFELSAKGLGGEPKARFGSRGTGNGKFSRPIELDLLDDETVAVLDAGSSCVQVFRAGKFVASFGTAETLGRPVGLCALEGKLYVVDSEGRRLIALALDGTMEQFALPPGPEPVSVASDPAAGRLVVLDAAGGITFFVPGRTAPAGRAGKMGPGLDPVTGASRVRVDPAGRAHVTAGRGRLLRYSPGGEFSGELGAASGGSFRRLCASGEELFAVEPSGRSVRVYDCCGWLRAILRPAGEPGRMTFSKAADCAWTNGLYILDSGSGSVARVTREGVLDVRAVKPQGVDLRGAIALSGVGEWLACAVRDRATLACLLGRSLSPKGAPARAGLSPGTLAVDSKGRLHLALKNELRCVSADGKRLFAELDLPQISALEASAEFVYALDGQKKELTLYSARDRYARLFSRKLDLRLPVDVACDATGRAFVLDGSSSAVVELRPRW